MLWGGDKSKTLYGSPKKFSYMTVKKEMLNCLIFVAKTTFLGALPVPPCKIILSEYDPSPKVPKEDLNFKRCFQFPQLLIIVGNIPVD